MVETVKTVKGMKRDIKRLKLSGVKIQAVDGEWHLNATQGTIGHNFAGKDLGSVWESMVRCLDPKIKNK
jgi:hypothetical protein